VIGLAMVGLSAGSVVAFMNTPRDKVMNLEQFQQLEQSPAPYTPQ
jgi:peptidase E